VLVTGLIFILHIMGIVVLALEEDIHQSGFLEVIARLVVVALVVADLAIAGLVAAALVVSIAEVLEVAEGFVVVVLAVEVLDAIKM